ncbi:hypothetical protein ABMA28_011002 [Loxostege sticticalis]|uniref:Uncharacterized protein n=1 Tax=Loxostege sticticalis TaxID=481309 RepID=A0ABD0S838_LOXSC
MRAWLVVCAALALAPCRATAAHSPADPARLERIKSHILAKLGLTHRPMPLGAPPRDVVQEILHRAQDNQPPSERVHEEHAMREIIAIAQTGTRNTGTHNPDT